MSPDDPRRATLERLRAVDRLVAGVVHDVSNPLASILGYAQLIQMSSDPAKIKEFAREIHAQATSARDLMQSFQHATEGRPLRPIRISAADLLVSTTTFAAAPLAADGITLSRAEGGEALFVDADIEAVRRVLGLLIRNAHEALKGHEPGSGGQKQVVIAARSTPDGVRIEVRDSGPGVPAEDRLRVFEPGVTGRRSGNGVGLGLPIALSVMDRLGGDLVLEDAPEGGCCAALVFPPSPE